MRTVLLIIFCGLSQVYGQKYNLYIGTYTGTGSKGIYTYEFDAGNGNVNLLSSTDSATNPSYLALSADGKNLYSVNETGGEVPGTVSAYEVDPSSGALTFLNSGTTGGDHPCYVSIDNSGKWLAVANYSGGNTSLFQIESDGNVGKRVQLLQDVGKGAIAKRQDKPHVHSATFSPDGKYLFTPDLGTDKIMIYSFDNSNSSAPLSPGSPASFASTPGNGPRHLTFSPDGKCVYVINELTGNVTSLSYMNGKLKQFQEVPAHDASYKGKIGSADIHGSPDGKFLYVSNRGDENTITGFSINKNGKLSLIQIIPTGGKTPRNFVIDPTGQFLLVANQNSDTITFFKRDMESGKLSGMENSISVPKPVCLKFSKIK